MESYIYCETSILIKSESVAVNSLFRVDRYTIVLMGTYTNHIISNDFD